MPALELCAIKLLEELGGGTSAGLEGKRQYECSLEKSTCGGSQDGIPENVSVKNSLSAAGSQ
jgi:hypothetical protein